jgi:hypothetical protein
MMQIDQRGWGRGRRGGRQRRFGRRRGVHLRVVYLIFILSTSPCSKLSSGVQIHKWRILVKDWHINKLCVKHLGHTSAFVWEANENKLQVARSGLVLGAMIY